VPSQSSSDPVLAVFAVVLILVLSVGVIVVCLAMWLPPYLREQRKRQEQARAQSQELWRQEQWRRWWWWRAQQAQVRAERLARLQTLQGLLSLTPTPTQFEDAVAELLTWCGYRNVVRTGGAGDLSADVKAVAPDGRPTVVQCKQYAPGNNVWSSAVQQLIGMAFVHHGAQLAIYVTTASYTKPARALAEAHPGQMEFWDGEHLVNLMRRHATRQQQEEPARVNPRPPQPPPPAE